MHLQPADRRFLNSITCSRFNGYNLSPEGITNIELRMSNFEVGQ